MRPDDFINSIMFTACRSCKEYKLPASCLIAQAAIESSWGEAVIGDYNMFGRKFNGCGDFIELPTYEWDEDIEEFVIVTAKFQDYDNLQQATDDWCQLMWWRNEDGSIDYRQYAEQYQIDHNLENFVRGIASIYATDPEYADKILATIDANDLRALDDPQNSV